MHSLNILRLLRYLFLENFVYSATTQIIRPTSTTSNVTFVDDDAMERGPRSEIEPRISVCMSAKKLKLKWGLS